MTRESLGHYGLADFQEYFKGLETCTLINCIGVLPDIAELQPESSYLANFKVVQNLVEFLKNRPQFNLVQMSTSLVFDGLKDSPYIETDLTSPTCVYGKHKALAEDLILDEIADQATIFRFGSLVTPFKDDKTTFNKFLNALHDDATVMVEIERKISIADSTMIYEALCGSYVKEKIIHITHSTPASWLAIVNFIEEAISSRSRIETFTRLDEVQKSVNWMKRPQNSSLASKVHDSWKQITWKQVVERGLKSGL